MKFIIRRLILAIPTLLGITVLTFAIQRAAPGDPVRIFTYAEPDISQEEIVRLRSQLGLDKPLPVQYLVWLGRIVRLDMGRSYATHRPVTAMMGERIVNTLTLSLTALLIALPVGIILGVYSAFKQGTILDNIMRVFAVLGNTMPHFWLGLLFILVFAVHLRWFPSSGVSTLGQQGFDLLDRLWHLFLPAIVLATGGIANYSRYMRTETLEVIRQDYIRTAYAKGLVPWVVLYRHALRNALIPLVTILGGSLASLFSGALVIENVFSWPGMGRLGYDAVLQRDYPVLMGLTVISSVLVILGYLLADIAYAIVDPRIRRE
jgi:peptide/nickel transport system permease protein